MKKLFNLFRLLYAPAAIGIYITTLVILTAFRFYTSRAQTRNLSESPATKLIRIAHQKSIDLRLQARGPRFGTEEVALLAVDERSLQTVGRWPWPRERIAEAIDAAVELGAKVIAFDMVFSEPSDQAALRMYEKVKESLPLPAEIAARFEAEAQKSDSDRLFAETLSRHGQRLVAGGFFEYAFDPMTSATYANACHNFVYEQSPAFKIWDKEEVILSVNDTMDLLVPDILADAYKQHLRTIEEEITKATRPPRNRLDEVELQTRIQNAKLDYCLHWLDPQKDELYEALAQNWEAVKAEDEDLKAATFEEWAEDFKSRFLMNSVLVADGWTMNTPAIAAGSKHTGYFNAQLDNDGTIRRARLVARTGNHYMPSLALKAFLVATNSNAEIVLRPDPKNPVARVVQSLRITNNETGEEVFSVPTDEEGSLMINYAGPRNMFAYASLGDLLTDEEEIQIERQAYHPRTGALERKVEKVKKADFFKGKTFVLGATAIGIFDLRVTPFDEIFPGAETHANVIDNLMRRDFLRTHPDEEVRMLLALIGLGVALSFALAHAGAISGMLIAAGTLAGIALADRYFLFANGIVVAVIFPLILVVLVYVGLTFYKYLTEERKKRELRSTFQKYVSPAIVDEILADPSNLELGGRKERITVFFSDLRGFTKISEKLDPRALSDFLNSYLTPMTDLVFEHRGTLDKYMGDAIMAFFGAPISYPDHAKWACRCALSHLRKLKELQDMYRKKGLPSIDIGIGLNTGECSVGNMGSQSVRNYTVMGDAVNLASRLEGINKQYGTHVIISEFTYEDVKSDFICREIDWVRVVGKALPVKIYELVAEGQLAAPMQELLTNFTAGYQMYRDRKFDRGLEYFTRALNIDPEDAPSQVYLERCQRFLAQPPPEDWDGVFVMSSK